MSSANKDTGLQQSCFSLGFPESISCFLIQTTRSRLACAESPNACRKKTIPQARQEPAWTGSGQAAPGHQAGSATPAPSHPGQSSAGALPRACLPPVTPPTFTRAHFEVFRVFTVAVPVVHSDRTPFDYAKYFTFTVSRPPTVIPFRSRVLRLSKVMRPGLKLPSRSEELGSQPWVCLQGSTAWQRKDVRLTTSHLLGCLDSKFR